MLNHKWLILNALFYTFFYLFPLVIIPTFLVNPKYDYLLFTQLSVTEGSKYTAELPTERSIKEGLQTLLGPPIGGFLSQIVFWIYQRIIGCMFERVTLDHQTHTFVGIRSGYIVALACINRVQALMQIVKKHK